MAIVRLCFLSAVAGLLLTGISASQAIKFYPDDPLQADPKPVSVGEIKRAPVFEMYDYLYQSSRPAPQNPVPAMGINTIGEVPDSAWFTNRHGRTPMTRAELQRGPGNENAPQPPFTIIGAKTDGITPGFRIRDAKGRLFFVKPDPLTNPELNTGAEVMGSKFFYAIGYNTPENYILRIRKTDWAIDKTAKIALNDQLSRKMTARDFSDIMAKAPLLPDGSFRVVASLAIPGKSLGPFRYESARSDDPNDLIPHENRRDLRGLSVFCAWLNHTDAKASNSLNTLIQENGVSFVRHFLIDFGSAFGSDGDAPKDARLGHEYQIPKPGGLLKPILSLSLISPEWERARYPALKAEGRIESEIFDPELWKPNYPNPAFLNRRPDDEYWAAKIVLAFTDEDIRALVETGEFSDPRVVEDLSKTLIQRRDKIGRSYLSTILPLDNFLVRDGELLFEDLAVRYKFRAALQYRISWFKFDNDTGVLAPLPGESSFRLPNQFSSIEEGDYIAAKIHAGMDERKTVTVFLRKKGSDAQVAGLEREW